MNAAKQSPRMEQDGTLRWYAGDTFTLTFAFNLKDDQGNPITINPTDELEVKFSNLKGEELASFSITGQSSIDLVFTEQISVKFPEGVYSVLAKFNATNVTTLLKSNRVVVE